MSNPFVASGGGGDDAPVPQLRPPPKVMLLPRALADKVLISLVLLVLLVLLAGLALLLLPPGLVNYLPKHLKRPLLLTSSRNMKNLLLNLLRPTPPPPVRAALDPPPLLPHDRPAPSPGLRVTALGDVYKRGAAGAGATPAGSYPDLATPSVGLFAQALDRPAAPPALFDPPPTALATSFGAAAHGTYTFPPARAGAASSPGPSSSSLGPSSHGLSSSPAPLSPRLPPPPASLAGTIATTTLVVDDRDDGDDDGLMTPLITATPIAPPALMAHPNTSNDLLTLHRRPPAPAPPGAKPFWFPPEVPGLAPPAQPDLLRLPLVLAPLELDLALSIHVLPFRPPHTPEAPPHAPSSTPPPALLDAPTPPPHRPLEVLLEAPLIFSDLLGERPTKPRGLGDAALFSDKLVKSHERDDSLEGDFGLRHHVAKRRLAALSAANSPEAVVLDGAFPPLDDPRRSPRPPKQAPPVPPLPRAPPPFAMPRLPAPPPQVAHYPVAPAAPVPPAPEPMDVDEVPPQVPEKTNEELLRCRTVRKKQQSQRKLGQAPLPLLLPLLLPPPRHPRLLKTLDPLKLEGKVAVLDVDAPRRHPERGHLRQLLGAPHPGLDFEKPKLVAATLPSERRRRVRLLPLELNAKALPPLPMEVDDKGDEKVVDKLDDKLVGTLGGDKLGNAMGGGGPWGGVLNTAPPPPPPPPAPHHGPNHGPDPSLAAPAGTVAPPNTSATLAASVQSLGLGPSLARLAVLASLAAPLVAPLRPLLLVTTPELQLTGTITTTLLTPTLAPSSHYKPAAAPGALLATVTYTVPYQKVPEELQEQNLLNAYPAGPRNVLNDRIFLYLDPQLLPVAVDINEYDLVINVAKECPDLSGAYSGPRGSGGSVGSGSSGAGSTGGAFSGSGFAGPTGSGSGSGSTSGALSSAPNPLAPLTPLYMYVPWQHTLAISKDLGHITDTMQQYLDRGQRILVHCQCGVSRLACVIVAFFMAKFGLGVNQAYELLKLGTAGASSDVVVANVTDKGNVIDACDRICPNMSLIFELMEFGDLLKQ